MDRNREAEDGTTRRGRPVKVARLIEEYELPGLGAELEERWTAPPDERESLRTLADWVNRRVLRAALESADVAPITSELDRYIDVLTGDSATSGQRTDVKWELKQNDVDVEKLESDFVSHQAIHSYLTDYRGVSLPEDTADAEDRVESGKQTINRLQGRLATVGESVLEQLRDAGHLTLGEFRVFIRFDVYCNDCDTQLDVDDLLSSGGCNCELEDG